MQRACVLLSCSNLLLMMRMPRPWQEPKQRGRSAISRGDAEPARALTQVDAGREASSVRQREGNRHQPIEHADGRIRYRVVTTIQPVVVSLFPSVPSELEMRTVVPFATCSPPAGS